MQTFFKMFFLIQKRECVLCHNLYYNLVYYKDQV